MTANSLLYILAGCNQVDQFKLVPASMPIYLVELQFTAHSNYGAAGTTGIAAVVTIAVHHNTLKTLEALDALTFDNNNMLNQTLRNSIHLTLLHCADTEFYTQYCCYYTINRSGREQTPTLMHVRLNDERQPLRGTARRCLQTGGVWLITVTKTVESETADSGGKRKRDSNAHDGQQKRVLNIDCINRRPARLKRLQLLTTRYWQSAAVSNCRAVYRTSYNRCSSFTDTMHMYLQNRRTAEYYKP
eukprot:6206-Heterococcus_DN1.PRE.2